MAKSCADGFWFITDLHTPANRLKSGSLLTRLVQTTPLRKVLSGGDLPEAFGGGGEKDTIEEAYEPFLIMEGYLERTPKGRVATSLAYERLGLPPVR